MPLANPPDDSLDWDLVKQYTNRIASIPPLSFEERHLVALGAACLVILTQVSNLTKDKHLRLLKEQALDKQTWMEAP